MNIPLRESKVESSERSVTFPDAQALEYRDLRVPFLEINTRDQWRYFIRNIDNGTFILVHDTDLWHRTRGVTRPEIRCFLYDKILRKLGSWDKSQILSWHDSRKRLWVSVTLPNYFCGVCEKRIKPYRKVCQSCRMKQHHLERSFFPRRAPVEISIGDNDMELAYRQFKMISRNQRLVVTHLDCNGVDRCLHVRYYFHRYRQTLPKRTSKVSGNITEVVQL